MTLGFDGTFNSSAEKVDGKGAIDMVYPIVLDFGLPDTIRQALVANVELITRYPHQSTDLKSALADYLTVAPSQIMPTAGVNGGLDLVARALLAGKKVLVPVPAFWQLALAPERYGATIVTCPLKDAAQMIARFSACDAIILSHPNNPLGTKLPQDTVASLLAVAEKRLVIVDESYADLVGETYASGTMPNNLIILRGFKAFLIPGARLGYVVGSDRLISRLHAFVPPFDVSVQAELAGIAVLGHLGEIKEIWSKVLRNRGELEAALLKVGGTYSPSTTLFACWQHPQAPAIGRALLARGVVTMFPGKSFILGMPPDCIRLTARLPQIQEEAMRRLHEVMVAL
ncbi:MAG: histidinol-phosphate aminotransferase family protein [Rhodospirillaceae bacterium]|nr:histidinol-phosphate aminotransferase family protein [Rhodospirillaceae bacterium]